MRRPILAIFPLLAWMLLAIPPVRSDDAVSIVLSDISEASGVANATGDRFSFADYDADGDPDLLVNGRTLLRNDTEGYGTPDASIRFSEVTRESGIGSGRGGGACWADFDGDGDLDVVTTGGALKLQDAEGHFTDQAAAWGLKLDKPMQSVGVLDVDGDGTKDVLFGGGEDWNDGNPVYYPRMLLRNVEGTRFEDVTADHDLDGGRYGRAVAQADYDRDGDLDVYLGNYRLMANELLANENGRLVDRAEAAGVAGRRSDDRTTLPNGQRLGYRYGHTIAASWVDLDADGDLDLWVSNLVHKFAGEHKGQYDLRGWICDDSALYRNDGGPAWTFTDMRGESGIPLKPTGDRSVFRGDELWSHAAYADLDLDGLPEVFVTQVYKLPYSHSYLFHNQGGWRFREISADVQVRRFDSYGGAFADVDGDGDPDLVTNGRGSPEGPRSTRLYRNDTATADWVAFRLLGKGGDPLPIGTQIVLETDRGSQVGQVAGAMGSYGQQNEGVVRFGLRDRTLTGVLVRWPGGLVQRLDAPATKTVHEIRRPSPEPPALRLDAPERAADGAWRLRARARGALTWRFRFDLDGDGTFETETKDGKAEAPATAREVRVRLWRRSKGIGREALWRLPAGE